MLDFKNIQETTNKMLVEARNYTETFWQKIFDIPHFDRSECHIAILEFSEENPIPQDADPLNIFDTLYFIIEYNCYGDIRVIFYPDISQEDIAFRLSAECLLNNNFVEVSELTFLLSNVNKI